MPRTLHLGFVMVVLLGVLTVLYRALLVSLVVVSGDYLVPGKIFTMCFLAFARLSKDHQLARAIHMIKKGIKPCQIAEHFLISSSKMLHLQQQLIDTGQTQWHLKFFSAFFNFSSLL